ncbi:MAG TPA: valine--tRNA ligase, partial [Planctomycetota bacterium]|nr:valine--tRNA ligase [Planctomycetota bacterium]
GLMYRGRYLVNWCPALRTALADDEVESREVKGHLWHVRYPVAGEPGRFVTVATTRPETMLGDTAVAVHPEDERYRDLIGKRLRLPLLWREIPVIADAAVDRGFGTGAVKVTPAHDPNDFEIGERHGLDRINILNEDGTINAAGGPYAGIDRFRAREAIARDLTEQGLLEKTEEHVHQVGHCYRSGDVVEPYLSLQWFVKMKPLAAMAIEATQSGKVRFHPERWTSFYLQWLENVRDWCVSRQLWWGHRIPVYRCMAPGCGSFFASVDPPTSPCAKCGAASWKQEEDVLDTWCSAWLWPFSTFGWPEKTKDLETFYPTDLLSTDRGILYFWVARMVMAGLEFMGEVPFRRVNIHGTVLDARGRRMSKSLGNGIDPLDMIAQYGADAVRFSLVTLSREGQDLKLSTDKFKRGQFFCNKVWNAARFVLMNLEGAPPPFSSPPTRLEDRWIRSRLAATVESVTAALEGVRFHDAAEALYAFTWDDFCDWTIELAKRRLASPGPDRDAARRILADTLDATLRLLHPFAPFVTEEIWTALKGTGATNGSPALLVAPWPKTEPGARDEKAEREMALVQSLIRAIRSIRHLHGIGEREALHVVVSAPDPGERAVLEREAELVRALGFVDPLNVRPRAERPPQSGVAVLGTLEVFVPLKGHVDLAGQSAVLRKKIEKVEQGIAQVRARLGNPRFVADAEPAVVEGERQRAGDLESELSILRRNLEGLG